MVTKVETIFTAQDRASAVMRQLGTGVDRLKGSFAALSTPLLQVQTLWASLAGGAAVTAITQLVAAIDDLDEAAQTLGTTAVELASLRRAGVEAGIGVEKLDTALTKLNVNMSQAAAGDPHAAAIFRAFGNEALNAAVKAGNSTEVLRQLAEEFSKLQDGPAKAALAVDLFGKAGAQLIPLLNGGADALDRFTGLTDKTVAEARRLQSEFDALGQSWERFKFQIGGSLIPAINDLVAVVGKLDLGKIRDEFNTFALGNFGAAFREFTRQVDEGAAKQRQLRDALKLGEGAYSNEGRAALQSAQSVRDKAAADEAAARATDKKTKATVATSNAYAQEFAVINKLRAARTAREDAAAEAAGARDVELIDQMTGRNTERDIQRRIELLNQMKAGEIAASREEIAVAEASIFGVTQGVNVELQKQNDLAEQIGLTISSSLGELITTGDKAGNVFKALGQDIAKLLTQLLILKPLAQELSKLFSGADNGSGGSNWISRGINWLVSLGGGRGQNANGSWGVVDTGAFPAGGAAVGASPQIVVNVGDATDRARVAMLVEQGVKAGLAASWDSRARGGSGVLA